MRKIVATSALVVFALLQPASADLRNFVGVCSDETASAHDVVQFCQRALDTGELDASAQAQVLANLGVGYFELRQFESAVDAYSRAIELRSDLLAAYLNRARAYEKLRRLYDAVADYEAVLRIDPKAADAYLGRGTMLLNHGDPRRAITDLTAAIELAPNWTSPHFNRGVAHLRLEEFTAAERDFTTVISQDAGDAGGYLNRGRARAALGLPSAADDFDQAIAVKPEWGAAWFARGRYRDRQGEREAANSDFIRAYELGHSDAWLLKRIREISG